MKKRKTLSCLAVLIAMLVSLLAPAPTQCSAEPPSPACPADASHEERAEQAYIRARQYQKNGDCKEAIANYKASRCLPALWAVSQWHIAECAGRMGDTDSQRKTLRELADNQHAFGFRGRAFFALARSHESSGENTQAKQVLAELIANMPNSEWAQAALYELAVLESQDPQGQDKAISLFRQYLAQNRHGQHALEAIDRLNKLPGYKPSAQDHDIRGLVYYYNQDWSHAISEWSGTDKHWYRKAVCLSKTWQYGQASNLLAAGIVAHPNQKVVPEAANLLAELESRQFLVDFWKKLASSQSVAGGVALWQLSRLATGTTRLYYCQRILDEQPKSVYEPAAAWVVFQNARQQGNYQLAVKSAQITMQEHPHVASETPYMAFWSGKMLEAQGESAREQATAVYQLAAALYPANYYGWRSRGRLMELSGGQDPGWSTNPSRPHPDPQGDWSNPGDLLDAGTDSDQALTLMELSKLHQWDECQELAPVGATTFKAAVLARLNKPLQSINSAAATLSGAPQRKGAWLVAYPLAYGAYISKESHTVGVDPLLVHSIIRQESRYMRDATSRSNAIGLMQLLPSTAWDIAERAGVRLYSYNDIYAPENNIRLGTWYIGKAITNFQGNAMLAVAGYNGGPGAVARWYQAFKESGQSDLDLFVERIPKDETRDYVKQVFQNFWNYQEMYKQGQITGHYRNKHVQHALAK